MEDYIVMRDYDSGWCEIFFFDHELTNGEVDRIQNIINHVKDTVEEYDSEDIETAIDEQIPYSKSIVISDLDNYHTVIY